MMLKHKTCSNCNYWSEHNGIVDGVVASVCEKTLVANNQLGFSSKVTKGGDTCGQWANFKFKFAYNYYSDTFEQVRDMD